jgi:hypothetical protein
MCVEASYFFVCERMNKASRYVSDWMLKKDVKEREETRVFWEGFVLLWAMGRGVLVFKRNAGGKGSL